VQRILHNTFVSVAGYGGLGAVGLLTGHGVVGGVLLANGLFWLSLWLAQRTVLGDLPVLVSVLRAIELGRLDDAEAMLVKLGAQPAGGDPRVRYFRALVALRRADLHAARAHLDAALGPRPSRISLLGRSEPLTQARALRAFVRAAQGDTAGAVDDAGAVRSDREADASSLAFAALAEAVVLERRGDRPGLRAHLAEHRPLLLGATGRRERALVRAYQRMLERPATSVYRESGGQALGAGGGEAALTAWVSRVAPGAAPFLRAAAPVEGESGASKAEPTAAPPRPARATSRRLLERLAWLAFGMLLGGAEAEAIEEEARGLRYLAP
jgi:hypothetical protein